MKVLVTGGSGFLGRHLLPQAIERGHQVVAIARSSRAARVVAELGATPIAGDLDDPAATDAAFTDAGADALVNLASLGFGHAPVIVSAAEEAGLKRAVFVSTTAVTTTIAAASKRVRLEAEETVRASALDWTIIRPTMIYGAPGDRNIARLLSALRRTPILPVPGGGNRLLQPVHVDDLAAAVLTAVESPAASGRTYDVAGPEPMPLAELLAEAIRATGSRARLVPVPLRPAIRMLSLYERLARRPKLKAEQLRRLAEDKAFSIEAAARDLGFCPRSFRTGVTEQANRR
ncbi:uncharacterized protein YbjT (DUF2867 family) [Saccharomonospora amisosensis]|uniref:Uncharacterized protein YbjT (DUF2867 family) n=1 Tax=Saccharomonospora amisosensis TaxID=1128677 RepID=A0A7X5UNS2_9PSEU|nr:SDR family NAD(P)-dependent oxidoreductase [Saccharomonospora amisosensis]NIJ11421.1 uncharacterized protein YbjT (DUF2867 family) [Saccharomonospora amisosensis]